jgi:hypothetical protein
VIFCCFCTGASLATAPYYVLRNMTLLGVTASHLSQPAALEALKSAVLRHLMQAVMIPLSAVSVLRLADRTAEAAATGDVPSCLYQDTTGLLFSEGAVDVTIAVECSSPTIASLTSTMLRCVLGCSSFVSCRPDSLDVADLKLRVYPGGCNRH